MQPMESTRYLEGLMWVRNTADASVVPVDVPQFGVGHSMGALVHALIACLHSNPTQSNVLISYNNRPVSEAIPIPGLLDNIREPIRQLTGSNTLAGGAQMLTSLLSEQPTVQQLQRALDPRIVNQLGPVVGQVPELFDQVGEGVNEFTPKPEETRRLIGSDYSVANTLLIRFTDDAIDQTEDIASVMQTKYPTSVISTVLPGTHVTPLGGDVQWEVGQNFSPVDAMAMSMKTASQQDVRRLSSWVLEWLDRAMDM